MIGHPLGLLHWSALRGRIRILGLATLGLAGLAGIAAAVEQYLTSHVPKMDGESRLVFRLDAPYSSVDLRPGADPTDVATIQTPAGLSDGPACRFTHGLRNGAIGILRIGVGDEGMLMSPPLAVWRARNNYWLVSSSTTESDMGQYVPPSSVVAFTFPPLYSDLPFRNAPTFSTVSADGGTVTRTGTPSSAGTKIFLSKDLPIDFAADIGFGESSLNLSGLPITNASIETEAARAKICSYEPNPQILGNFSVRAGLGECTFCGISNLNAKHFTFHGGVGSYHLGFEGHLMRDLDAQVELGLGMCTITIPPTSARVQVFYDDGFLSSYSFSGLVKRRDGYATSVGFEHSTSPVLTLRLSAGAGRVSVSYH